MGPMTTRRFLPALGLGIAAVVLLAAACGGIFGKDNSTFTSPPSPTQPVPAMGPRVYAIDPSLCSEEDAPPTSSDTTFSSPSPLYVPTIKERERSRTGLSDLEVHCVARLASGALPAAAVNALYGPDDRASNDGNGSDELSKFRFSMVSVEGTGPTVMFNYVWDVPPNEQGLLSVPKAAAIGGASKWRTTEQRPSWQKAAHRCPDLDICAEAQRPLLHPSELRSAFPDSRHPRILRRVSRTSRTQLLACVHGSMWLVSPP